MARHSDTREKTREAAALLVKDGFRPDEVTVDRIYGEIGQGSRTTINDELKRWKDEQFKLNSLGATVPPEVLAAVTSLWALAVDHGERTFDQRRRALETERAELQAANVRLESSLVQEQGAHTTTRGHADTLAQENRDLRDQLSSAQATAAAAQRRIAELEAEVVRVRADSDAMLAKVREGHAEQQSAWAKRIADQEQAFRTEIDKTIERLEGVQRRVLLQVDEAREETKQVAAELASARQRYDQVAAEAHDRLSKISSLSAELSTLKASGARSDVALAEAQAERDSQRQRATALESELRLANQQLDSMTSLASNAELRLDAALRLGPKGKGSKGAAP